MIKLKRTVYWTPSMFVALMLAHQGWINENVIIVDGDLEYKMVKYEVDNESIKSIEENRRDLPYT